MEMHVVLVEAPITRVMAERDAARERAEQTDTWIETPLGVAPLVT